MKIKKKIYIYIHVQRTSMNSKVTEAVQTVFGEKFHIDPIGSCVVEIKFKSDDTVPCLTLLFLGSRIHISKLNKCRTDDDFRSGSELLRMVDILATHIPECKSITLKDASYIKRCGVTINLAKLKILETGASWYNHFGFKQPSYELDKSWNARWIDLHHESAAIMLLDPDRSPDFVKKNPNFATSKKWIDEKFPELRSIPLNQYIKRLFELIKGYPENEDNCDDSHNEYMGPIIDVIVGFQYYVKYNEKDENLTKGVEKKDSSKGGGAKKSLRKPRKKTRRKVYRMQKKLKKSRRK